MKNTKRALRRHHRQRKIAFALRSHKLRRRPEAERKRLAVRWHDHLQYCACALCSHRRKWYGPTVQERRQSPGEEWNGWDAAVEECPNEVAWPHEEE